MRALLIAVLAVASLVQPPSASAAQEIMPTFSIESGEAVVVRVAEDGSGFVPVSREPVSSAGEEPAEPDRLRFVFLSDGDQRMLWVQNGYDRAFEYRAHMFLERRSAPTSTCTVLPRIISYEHWPHPIDRLEISSPRLSEADGSSLTCR